MLRFSTLIIELKPVYVLQQPKGRGPNACNNNVHLKYRHNLQEWIKQNEASTTHAQVVLLLTIAVSQTYKRAWWLREGKGSFLIEARVSFADK